jgi:hypothetical protein
MNELEATTALSDEKLRLVVFPDQPEFLVVFVPDGARLRLPECLSPFRKRDIVNGLADLGVVANVREGQPGRWTQSFQKMQNDAKAERGQKQRLREAADAHFGMRSADAATRDRSALMQEKHDADDQIRKLKAELQAARGRAARDGQYMDPGEYRKKEQRLGRLKQRSQALQTELGNAKKKRHANWAQTFYAAAQEALTEEEMQRVVTRAHELESESDSCGAQR